MQLSKIKFGALSHNPLYSQHYLVAIPRSINTPHVVRVLIYKEAARDQAQWPAGNPSMLKKVPIPVPANNTGEYKFITMKSLIKFTQRNAFYTANGNIQHISAPISCICMCCCCWCLTRSVSSLWKTRVLLNRLFQTGLSKSILILKI